MPIIHVRFLTLPVADHARARHFQLRTTDLDGHGIGLLEASGFGNRPR
ncbi:hypothetical protein [Amycolatopsis sp. NBC_00438]